MRESCDIHRVFQLRVNRLDVCESVNYVGIQSHVTHPDAMGALAQCSGSESSTGYITAVNERNVNREGVKPVCVSRGGREKI
jgi:hypothetical protein